LLKGEKKKKNNSNTCYLGRPLSFAPTPHFPPHLLFHKPPTILPKKKGQGFKPPSLFLPFHKNKKKENTKVKKKKLHAFFSLNCGCLQRKERERG